MEKAAATGKTGVRWEKMPACTALVATVCLCAPAWAQDGAASPAEVVVAEARMAEAPVRVQVQASALPRIDAQDSGFQAPRVDVSVYPSPHSTGLGAVLGLSTPRHVPGLQPAAGSNVDLGVRWTQRIAGQNLIDLTAWRRMNADQDAATLAQQRNPTVYGARVELNMQPVRKAGLTFDRGIGLQLESGARISIKRRHGGPMVYYRTSF